MLALVPDPAQASAQESARKHRFLHGDAIINAPYQVHSDQNFAATHVRALDKLKSQSFSSLLQERLSKIAVRVTIARKARASDNSVRYLKSRNPCNEPVIKRLLRVSPSLSCEPNWEARITLVPNDTRYSNMYSANSTSAGRIHLPEAWALSTGSSSIVVGIIDTGVDFNHPDLAANIWTNPGEIPSNGIDDDGNSYVDDVHGIDTANGDSNPFDDQSHGTHVAGTIGAVGNNSLGVVGINWNIKMIACKAFSSAGTAYVSAIVSCLNYLVQLKSQYGINIVATSNSYGGYPFTNSMYNAIASSRDTDMAFVAGAGNNGTNNDTSSFYPANFAIDSVVSVGATDILGHKANFSNYGATSVDISAPGVSVLSTIPGNQYAYFNGTSMATPHVAGAVALVRAYHPSYVYSQAISSVLNTGTSFAELAGKNATGAILNVGAALAYDAPTPTPGSTPIPPQTEVPTVEPTPVPGTLPAAKLDILAVNSRTQSKVTCVLSALSGMDYAAVPGRVIKLAIKGEMRQRSATTNDSGTVSFVVRPPKGKSYSAQCLAKVTDSTTNKAKKVKSRQSKLKLTKR